MNRSSRIVSIFLAAALLFAAGCAGVPVKETAIRPITEGMSEEAVRAFNSAESAFKEGRLDRAMELYGFMLERFPSGKAAFVAHLRRGEILAIREEYARAIKELGLIPRGFEDDPLYPEARYHLARSHAALGEYGTADTIVTELLAGTIPARLKATIESLKGDILTATGKHKEALDWYLKSLKSEPDKPLEEGVKKKAE
ncbi:MAG: tetratricopeptide repeat protein, partial [Syntrophaceae bacterium]|nr:tetratricopeptide repeat protein [Syntrophaceae bacterium]